MEEFAAGSILASLVLLLFSIFLLLRLRRSPNCWSGFKRPEKDEFWHGLLLLFALAGLLTLIVSTAVILAVHHSAGTSDPLPAGYRLLAIYILEVAQVGGILARPWDLLTRDSFPYPSELWRTRL